MGRAPAVRIVIAEDCGADVILIEESLRTAGLYVDLRIFPDGEECACYLKSHQEIPNVIILDLNLPRLDGFELLQVVRAEPRYARVPVAVLTSSSLPEDRQKSIDLGADAFITKPSTLDDFLEKVGTAVRGLLRSARSEPRLASRCR